MLDPLAPLEAVRINGKFPDPALSSDMDLVQYRKDREPSQIKEIEGMKAVRFVLKPLPAAFVAEVVDSLDTLSQRKALSFCASCHEIKLADGKTLKADRLRAGLYGTQIASMDDWLGEVRKRFGMAAIYEMGDLAWQRAQLPDEAISPFV